MTSVAEWPVLTCDELKEKYDEFPSLVNTLQTNLASSLQEINQVQFENSNLKAMLESKSKDIAQLQLQIEKLQKTLHEHVYTISTAFNSQSELNDLKETVVRLKKQNESSLLEIKNLKQNLLETHEKYSLQETSWKETLRKQADAVDEQKMETLNVIEQKSDIQSRLELEIEKLKEQLNHLKKQP